MIQNKNTAWNIAQSPLLLYRTLLLRRKIKKTPDCIHFIKNTWPNELLTKWNYMLIEAKTNGKNIYIYLNMLYVYVCVFHAQFIQALNKLLDYYYHFAQSCVFKHHHTYLNNFILLRTFFIKLQFNNALIVRTVERANSSFPSSVWVLRFISYSISNCYVGRFAQREQNISSACLNISAKLKSLKSKARNFYVSEP